MQDLPVILKRDNLQSLDKVFEFFIALKFCNSDFYFLNRLKKCEVATYNIVSVYIFRNVVEQIIEHLWKCSETVLKCYNIVQGHLKNVIWDKLWRGVLQLF